MNTKPVPAVVALLAGFVTCIMSFVQHVDITVFAKRFIIVCIVFFIAGCMGKIVLDMNFKEMAEEPEEADASEDENGELEETENPEESVEENE